MTNGTADKPPIIIATRGSTLALWQADFVSGLLAARGHRCEKLVIKTTADRIQDRFLHEIGGKGLFIRELEQALVDGKAHIAVHSLKDMTARLEAPFALGAVLKRHSPADAMIFRSDVARRLEPLPPLLGAADVAGFGKLKVGTGSLRRQAIFTAAAPQLELVGIRGNVDTRIRKMEEGAWDAIVLAEASLDRLGIRNVTYRRLDPAWFIPAASQGALAIECLDTGPARSWLAPLADDLTTACVGVERALLARLGGDCNLPFGAHVAATPDGHMHGRAAVWNKQGDKAAAEHRGVRGGAFLDEFFDKVKAAGAARILADLGLEVPAALA